MNENEPIQQKPNRKDTLRSTQEFNEKYFSHLRQSLSINNFSIMKDDIKNFRPLTEIQLIQLESLSEIEIIEIIKLYNIMMNTINTAENVNHHK
jgi:hypothetical protein